MSLIKYTPYKPFFPHSVVCLFTFLLVSFEIKCSLNSSEVQSCLFLPMPLVLYPGIHHPSPSWEGALLLLLGRFVPHFLRVDV